MNEGWNDISMEGNDVFIEGDGIGISQDINPIRLIEG